MYQCYEISKYLNIFFMWLYVLLFFPVWFREVSLYKPLSPHAKIMIFVTFSAWLLATPAPCQVPSSMFHWRCRCLRHLHRWSDLFRSDPNQSNPIRGGSKSLEAFQFRRHWPKCARRSDAAVIVIDVVVL